MYRGSGKAQETPDPHGRMLSASSLGNARLRTQGDNMTGGNPPDEGIPAGGAVDYAKIIDELKAANVALIEKVNALEERSKGFDQKITALSGEAAKANAAKKDEIETKKKEFDASYERAMESLGFRIKKE